MGTRAGSARELKLLAEPMRAVPDQHHVKALLDAGLLEMKPQGRTVWCGRARPGRPCRRAGNSAVGDLDVPSPVGPHLCRSRYALLRRLPSVTARFASDRLAALAIRQRRTLDHVPEVLFVCVQNAGRSQREAGILRQLARESVTVRTAGTAPAGAVRSIIVTVLDEIGVSIDGKYPKPLTDDVVRAADVVVTMGCGDACPIDPGRRYLDWDIEDPVDLPLAHVRDIRDDIDARVRQLLTTLAMASP